MRKIKYILIAFISITALPIGVIFSLLGIIFSIFDRYSEVSMLISRVPFYIGEISRLVFYKLTLKKVGNKVQFKYGSCVLYRNTEIGENVLIGYNTLIGESEIGNDVLIGSCVNITSGLHQHMFDNPKELIRKQKGKRKKIKIGNDIWIGNNAVIAADINDRSVIGLGGLVIKDIDKSGVYVGVPTRLVKELYKL